MNSAPIIKMESIEPLKLSKLDLAALSRPFIKLSLALRRDPNEDMMDAIDDFIMSTNSARQNLHVDLLFRFIT